MFDLDRCVAFITNTTSKILSDSLNNALKEYGVTKTQRIALYFINREESISQKELSNLMGNKESTIAGIIKRLERLDYVSKSLDKDDKRKNLIYLTKKGKTINKKLTKIAEDFKNTCLKDIDYEEQMIFLKVLDKMSKEAEDYKYIDNKKE